MEPARDNSLSLGNIRAAHREKKEDKGEGRVAQAVRRNCCARRWLGFGEKMVGRSTSHPPTTYSVFIFYFFNL
ncbi:unnamed protein product [Cuscuta campestris]|uniref:Uncharacterized protein n=1 Tax=Cuscuta campestris TaxID=132261 RepID=A0A484KKB7_9ASTE|nr:unnamed protein product [Cuscuta campestris]